MAEFNLSKKQSKAWKLLNDTTTQTLLFGGGVGGGKSFLGCLWVSTMCLQYAGTRYLIGRTRLTQLRLTTLKTLFEVFKIMGLEADIDYKYNGQSNVIAFTNGSEIVLKDLQYNPSDSQWDSLGSLEITGAFIDEAAQIQYDCYQVIKSRIRFQLTENNLKGKILMTCNPSSNWLKSEFYDPYVKEELDPSKAFIQSLPTDNPHLNRDYLETLNTLPEKTRRRLLDGDWNFMDDDDALFTYNKVSGAMGRYPILGTELMYLSVDVARFGSDRTVIGLWYGLALTDLYILKKKSTVEVSTFIKDLMLEHAIPSKRVIVDSDGVGGGVSDQLRAVDFVNNSKALHGENYVNLKTQCYVKLADMLSEGLISILVDDVMLLDELTQELLAVKLKNPDLENKLALISKDEMKRVLGKSPDISDTVMMRMYFELKNNKITKKYGIKGL